MKGFTSKSRRGASKKELDSVTVCCLLRFSTSAYVLNSLSRFISRAKRFHPFYYACLSVGLLQSTAMDYTVYGNGLYSPPQRTVRSTVGDCNNLPFKKP